MFFIDFLFVLVFAILFTGIFARGVSKYQTRNDLFIFFILILLITWSGGRWITPIGPLLWGVPWLSFMIVGLFFALLLTAINHGRYRSYNNRDKTNEKFHAKTQTIYALNIFFWILAFGLCLSIILAYI